MWKPRGVGWPIALTIVMIVLLAAVMTGWILGFIHLAAQSPLRSGWYWFALAMGTTFLALILVGVVLHMSISVKEIRLSQRQANFIDSVTHELKSPIASLKLYLQTLDRRALTDGERAAFQKYMMEDVERLHTLINHLLDAARAQHAPTEEELVEVEVKSVLERCAEAIRSKYLLPPDAVRLEATAAIVRGRPVEVEMIFRNIIDNAVKYAEGVPEVRIESCPDEQGQVRTRILDNGPGIPARWRRKIFGRFVRLGNELERSKQGTGLGLYIVHTLVRRMKGRVFVRDRGVQTGTEFEVLLPSGAADAKERAA